MTLLKQSEKKSERHVHLRTTAVVVRNSAAPASARSPAPVHRRAISTPAGHPALGSRERIRIACSQGKFTAEL
jgi:hypothetical protein